MRHRPTQSLPFGIIVILVNAIPNLLWAQTEQPNGNAPAQDVLSDLQTTAEQRLQFQMQELITAKSAGWIFAPANTPRIIWRDVDAIRELGGDVSFRVRWFNRDLEEFAEPAKPDRWMAWIEGTAPNGTVMRRALTFYAIPPDLNLSPAPDLSVEFPRFPGDNLPVQWHEHQEEFARFASTTLVRSMIDSEQGAILIAGTVEAEPLGRPARFVESASVVNDEFHLKLKLKLQGRPAGVEGLRPPRQRSVPATVIHDGSAEQAGVPAYAKSKIDQFCQAWADDTGEPFVTLVARRGVIVTHRAFGNDATGKPVDLDYRCWVASITKTVTGLMFSQFLDQRLVELDDPLSKVFADYPSDAAFVPTFRQCLNHTSGLSGQGDFGGMKNPHLENVILNGLDVNVPNSRYAYSGMGFELTAKAMEILAGKCAARVYSEHLFEPLGFGDVRLGNASSDGEFTALELGKLGQWVANRGSYGELEFISPETFEKLLPRPIKVAKGQSVNEEGVGIHFVRHLKPGAPANSIQPEDLLFSARTLGHGSFSGCIFVVDPEQQLVITQVRRQLGSRHGEYWQKFFQSIAEAISSEDAADK